MRWEEEEGGGNLERGIKDGFVSKAGINAFYYSSHTLYNSVYRSGDVGGGREGSMHSGMTIY